MIVLKTVSFLAFAVSILGLTPLQADLIISDPNTYSPVSAAIGMTPLVSPNGVSWAAIGSVGVYMEVAVAQSSLGTQYNLSSFISVPASDETNRVVLRTDTDTDTDIGENGQTLGFVSIDGRGFLTANNPSFGPSPQFLSGVFTTSLNLNKQLLDGSWSHSSVIQQNGVDVPGSYRESSSSTPFTTLRVSVFGEGTGNFSNLQLTGITAVPEPSSLTLSGLLLFALFTRRRVHRSGKLNIDEQKIAQSARSAVLTCVESPPRPR